MKGITITLSTEEVEMLLNTLREAAINKVREAEELSDAAHKCSRYATELTNLADKIHQA